MTPSSLCWTAPGDWHALGDWVEAGGSTGFFGEIESLSGEDDIPTCAAPDDFGVIFYTSGTVARPKGVIQIAGWKQPLFGPVHFPIDTKNL